MTDHPLDLRDTKPTPLPLRNSQQHTMIRHRRLWQRRQATFQEPIRVGIGHRILPCRTSDHSPARRVHPLQDLLQATSQVT